MADEDLTIFPDVKRQMFQYYTRRTCVLECLSTAIMDRCGCLPYFYPDFGEVWGAHPELGHPDWADTTCNETGYLCVSAYAGNQLNNLINHNGVLTILYSIYRGNQV